MQNQTPTANSRAKFQISPQEGSDLANISHSKISNKQNKLKHQPIIEIAHLQPEKQIQITRKSQSNQQGDSNIVRKWERKNTLSDITDRRPNRRFYVRAISSAYGEVALTKKRKEKVTK
jgi:hypothetical protein